MRTHDVTIPAQRSGPRVWLVADDTHTVAEPADHPVVRDDQMRQWIPDRDGDYATTDGRHHATWAELHARFDLIELPAAAGGWSA